MFGMSKEQFLSFIRHVVTFIGGILIAKSGMDPTAVETITGVIVTIAGLIFGFVEKSDRKIEPPKTPPVA